MALLCKNKEEGGSARASPVAALMPKSVFFLREKIDCLKSFCVSECVPFIVGVTLYL